MKLILPFLDSSLSFACGVEIGLLYARMQSGEDAFGNYYLLRNESMVLLAASRLGWYVAELEYPKEYPKWFWVRMERRRR